MGLAALRKVLDPQPLDVATLRGKVVAVDADNLVWSFVTAIAGVSGKVPPGAHLIGLVGRLKFYAQLGVKSAWVFDGEQPALKAGTLAEREQRVAAAGGVWVGQREMDDCKELLSALGIPWWVAPGESDAQCAFFVREGHAWAAVTQDWDIAMHGAPRALRNLSGGKTKTPELLDLERSLAQLAITRAQLVDAAILIGTDYNAGLPGIGPVKALGLVKKHGDLHGALRALGVAMPEADELRALFLAHKVDAGARPRFAAPRVDAVVTALARGGLSGSRADEVTEAVRALHAS